MPRAQTPAIQSGAFRLSDEAAYRKLCQQLHPDAGRKLRGRLGDRMAFLDAGDQFIALSVPRTQPPDEHRHFGLVVDDKSAVREALAAAGAEVLPGRGLSFRDPFGNHVQVIRVRRHPVHQGPCRAGWGTTIGLSSPVRAVSSCSHGLLPERAHHLPCVTVERPDRCRP
ncbi:MAG: hypothetical protein LC808_04685 [Actinobacteria bacterium]|nr:hypothetical protein [Actinomycetota bacterium]